jgi:O-antigen/teichoic acid export membrane protein
MTMIETVRERETVAREIQTAVRHSAVYGLGGVLAKGLGFFMLPFYTHYLSPSDYGILEILDLSMSLFGMFLNMGMTAAMLRCYAGATSAEEKRKTVSTAFLFVAVTGVATFCLMLGLVRPISALIFGPSVPVKYLLLSFSSFILGYIANLPRTYLRALEASGAFVAVDTFGLFLMLALNIYFIAVAKIGLLGILLSSFIVVAIQMVLLSGWMLRQVRIRFSGRLLRQMVGFGLPLIFSNLALFAMNFSDRFFLQHLRSLEVVGLYAVGYKFGFMMNYLLVQPFNAMWQARMYVIHAQPDHPQIFSQIFVLYSLLLTYVGLALSMLSPEIVHIMVGPKFAASGEIIPVVALAYVFYGVGYYVQLGTFLTNNTKLIGTASAAAAVLNLVLNYFLILHYGMMGAAWATLLSFAALAAGSYLFSQRVFPLSLGLVRVGGALALAIGFYLVSRWWSPSALGAALSMKAFLLGIFPLSLWKLRILSPAQVEALSSTRKSAVAGVSRLLGLAAGRA